MLRFMIENKRNKLIISLIVLLIILSTLVFRYLYFNVVRTDERIMNEVELIERRNIIYDILDNDEEYFNAELKDIFEKYMEVHTEITVDDNFDYLIVKQQYKIDKKFGWIPIGMPDVQIFYKTN